MAGSAVAQEAVCALRRKIAAIENRSPVAVTPANGRGSKMDSGDEAVLMRQNGTAAGPGAQHAVLPSGAETFDFVLGGGLPAASLSEIHAAEARDAGAGSGFALALASLVLQQTRNRPVLWVGTAQTFRESGFPHAAGLQQTFAISAGKILFSQTDNALDALWIAGEVAGLDALSAVILEMRGNPASLDLTATRRLHRRARAAGRPVFLLRISSERQPTAAPVRLCVSAAPASPRMIFAEPLAGSLGAPAFTVAVDKCRANPGRQFILEWNCHERRFRERQPGDPVAMAAASVNRQDPAPAFRQVLAFGSGSRRRTG